MPKPKRLLHATALATTTPPTSLPPTHTLARVTRLAGNNLYEVAYPVPSSQTTSTSTPPTPTSAADLASAQAPTPGTLVELPPRFRNAIWLKRGSYVIVDTAAFAARENKLGGEIVNVVREEREWRKMGYWPRGEGNEGFEKRREVYGDGEASQEESEDEKEKRAGRMPTPESEGEGEEEG